MDIVKRILEHIIAIVAVGAISYFFKPINKFISEIFDAGGKLKKFKNMGLDSFLSDNEFPKDVFDKMIENGKAEDEILVVGRTLNWLITNKRNCLIKGLGKGLHFKLLLLNPEKIKNKTLNITILQLKDKGSETKLYNELEDSINKACDICEEALQGKFGGILEVKICDFVVPDSLLSFTHNKKEREIILDFSFSFDRDDKYQQLYKYAVQENHNNDHFCDKLYNFYNRLFETKSELYIKYSDKKIKYSKNYVEKDVDDLAETYSEAERMRENEPKNILPKIPNIFNFIQNKGNLPSPISIQLELTNKCGMASCIHCQRHTWSNHINKKEISSDRIKSLLGEFQNMRVQSVTFSGGEPTTHPQFVDILKHAHDLGLKIGILTNGLSINGDLAKAIVRNSNWVRISLDGSTEIIYKKIRGNNADFNSVISSINNLNNAKMENRSECKIGICYSIQNKNIGELSEGDGVDNLINQLNNSLRFSVEEEKLITFKFVHGKNGFLCRETDLQNLLSKIKVNTNTHTWHNKTNIKYLAKFMESYSNISDIAQGIPINKYYENKPTKCFTPYIFSLVDAFGDVYPCCFLYHDNEGYDDTRIGRYKHKRSEYIMGNILDNPFSDVWSNQKYNGIRNNLEIIAVDKYEECKECTRHYYYNTFLTKLFNKYKSYIKNSSNADEIGNLFNGVLGEYQLKDVWL